MYAGPLYPVRLALSDGFVHNTGLWTPRTFGVRRGVCMLVKDGCSTLVRRDGWAPSRTDDDTGRGQAWLGDILIRHDAHCLLSALCMWLAREEEGGGKEPRGCDPVAYF